jgi:hypothetical protein
MSLGIEHLNHAELQNYLQLNVEHHPDYAKSWREWCALWRRGNWDHGGPWRRLTSCITAVQIGDRRLIESTLELGDLTSQDDVEEAWRIASSIVAIAVKSPVAFASK